MTVRTIGRLGGLALCVLAAVLPAASASPGRDRVVSAGTAAVRFTLPASTSSDNWYLVLAKVVGDLNGDRVPDLAFAVDHVHRTGQIDVGECTSRPHSRYVQVVFGGSLPSRIDLRHPGVRGFRIAGLPGSSELGQSLAGVGDVDGDGLDDLAIGAPGDLASPGAAYVVYGKRSSDAVDLSTLGDSGFELEGDLPWGAAGMQVAGGGDVNGDGRPDVLVGAEWLGQDVIDHLRQPLSCRMLYVPPAESLRSVVYAVFGGKRTGSLDLGNLGENGFEVSPSKKLLSAEGAWLADVGDVDGDGLDDIGIGQRDGATIVLGRSATDAVDVAHAPRVVQVRIRFDEHMSPVVRSVAAAGDVDGDGHADILVGAEGSRVPEDTSAYLVYGRRTTAPVETWRPGSRVRAISGSSNAGNGTEQSVFGLGDLNGDRIPDAAVLARTSFGGQGGGGSLYVAFGGSAEPLSLASLGKGGARIDGAPGTPISGAGGAGDVVSGGGRELLVYGGLAAELVRFAPVEALPAPHVAATIALPGRRTTVLASAFGSVWAGVEGEDDGLLVRVDPATNRVTGRTGLGGVPKAIGAGDGSLWVFVLTGRRHQIAAKLLRVDAASGRVLVRRTLDTGRPNVSQVPGSESIHYGFGSLWITDGPRHRVYRFDPASGRVLASVKVGLCPQGLAFAGGRVWIADRQDGAVRELDPARNRVVGRAIAVSTYDQSVGRSLGDMLWLGARDGRVWIYDPSRPGLVVLDPATRRITATPSPAAGRAGGVAASGSTLWLADGGGIGRIGLADGRPIGSRLPLQTASTGTSFAAGSFWVTDDFGARLVRIDPPQPALKRSA